MVEKLSARNCRVYNWAYKKSGVAFCDVKEFPNAKLVFHYDDKEKRGKLTDIKGEVTTEEVDYLMKKYGNKLPNEVLTTEDEKFRDTLEYLSGYARFRRRFPKYKTFSEM